MPHRRDLHAALALLALAGWAAANPPVTVSPGSRFAWAENLGWLNFGDASSPSAISVYRSFLAGRVWSESTGWINFGSGAPADGVSYANADSSDFGVNLDPATGNLSGYAWGENTGWVNLSGGALASPPNPARITLAGARRFAGYAWGENIGWINFDGASTFVGLLCPMDFNADGFVNLDDLGDLITDFYTAPAIPGGLQPAAPTFADQSIGYGVPCPAAAEALGVYAPDAYLQAGFRVAYSVDGSNSCPLDPSQPFPNLDNLADFITDYYAAFASGC